MPACRLQPLTQQHAQDRSKATRLRTMGRGWPRVVHSHKAEGVHNTANLSHVLVLVQGRTGIIDLGLETMQGSHKESCGRGRGRGKPLARTSTMERMRRLVSLARTGQLGGGRRMVLWELANLATDGPLWDQVEEHDSCLFADARFQLLAGASSSCGARVREEAIRGLANLVMHPSKNTWADTVLVNALLHAGMPRRGGDPHRRICGQASRALSHLSAKPANRVAMWADPSTRGVLIHFSTAALGDAREDALCGTRPVAIATRRACASRH